MADETVYVVAEGVTLYATDEKTFVAGDVVTAEDFESVSEYKGLIKAGKIVPQSPSPEPTPEGDWDTFSIDSELDSASPNPVKNSTLTPIIEGLEEADTTLQGLITDERTNRGYADETLQGNIDAISAKIPAQASSSNQLADKDFVNSSISTNTAHYISNNGEPFTSVSALPADASMVTDNDYAFVTGTDSAGNTYYDRYKASVSGETVSWAKEYRLNNSSFTAEQWAAISSGITSTAVAQIESNRQAMAEETEARVAADEALQISVNGKQNALTFDDVPTSGSNNVAKSGGIFQANQILMASSTTITGAAISSGAPVRVLFTAAIDGADTTTGLSLTYNGNNYAVKVGKQGALADFVASEVNGAYKYLQAYTTLEMMFDGTQFIIIGNPVVLSSSDYTIYADGNNTLRNFCFIKNAGGVTQYATIKLRHPSNSGFGSDHICFIQNDYLSRLFRVDCVTGEAYPIASKETLTALPYITGVYADTSNMIVYIRFTGYRGNWVEFWQYVSSISYSTTAPDGIAFNDITFISN